MNKFLLAAAILAAGMGATQRAAAAALLTNGSFETGFDGWTLFGDDPWTAITEAQPGPDGVPLNATPRDGLHYAIFGPVEVAGLAQAAGSAGITYDVSFELANQAWWGDGTPSPEDLATSAVLNFGGVSLTLDAPMAQLRGQYIEPGELDEAWRHYSFRITALDDSGLSFAFHNPLSYFLLDNVSVAEVPVSAGVPEPASWVMMVLGFGLTGGMLRRRGGVHVRVGPSSAVITKSARAETPAFGMMITS